MWQRMVLGRTNLGDLLQLLPCFQGNLSQILSRHFHVECEVHEEETCEAREGVDRRTYRIRETGDREVEELAQALLLLGRSHRLGRPLHTHHQSQLQLVCDALQHMTSLQAWKRGGKGGDLSFVEP